MIISRGSDLPFILVMLGVFGGVVAFGFIGVFLGPVLLAIAFALVKEWAEPTRRDQIAWAGCARPTNLVPVKLSAKGFGRPLRFSRRKFIGARGS